MEFTHFDNNGNAIMVDISDKEETKREACAIGRIKMSKECFSKIKTREVGKGDVLAVARVAGIMGAKKTSELTPLCHVLLITSVKIEFSLFEEVSEIEAKCIVKTTGKTGAEMEALTGVNISLLTIYDMCKAIDKNMIMNDIHLHSKSGGKSGDYHE
ncbi:MAG: cyclic pyranopterin monophosphate synthase MoaC [Suipraeoptans sp.]